MYLNFTYNGRDFFNTTPEHALAEGVPQAAIDTEFAKLRAVDIKAECRRRIYVVAPAETQMNMAAASAFISSKEASARSDGEKQVLAGLESAIGWVSAMRGNVGALVADPATDFTADQHWPAVPAAAAAFAAQV